PSKGYRPDYKRAGEWWGKCAEWTDSTQLLWAQAQMGLASSAIASKQSGKAKSPYDKILSIDPNSIQLDKSKGVSQMDLESRRQELARLRGEMLELQKTARKTRAYANKITVAKKNLLRYRERQSLWSFG